jgi:isopentenyldiphosphate isomerase
MMSSQNELVQIVDKNNTEIAAVQRSIMREQKLIHRASYVFVFNKQDELYIQRRTMTKDIYPGYWDVAAGGVALALESYEDSAARELEEELGIKGKRLEYCFDHFYQDKDNKVWGRVYRCRDEGPFMLQKEEIEYGMFVPIPTVLRMREHEPFTPDGNEILKRLYEEV